MILMRYTSRGRASGGSSRWLPRPVWTWTQDAYYRKRIARPIIFYFVEAILRSVSSSKGFQAMTVLTDVQMEREDEGLDGVVWRIS